MSQLKQLFSSTRATDQDFLVFLGSYLCTYENGLTSLWQDVLIFLHELQNLHDRNMILLFILCLILRQVTLVKRRKGRWQSESENERKYKQSRKQVTSFKPQWKFTNSSALKFCIWLLFARCMFNKYYWVINRSVDSESVAKDHIKLQCSLFTSADGMVGGSQKVNLDLKICFLT